MENQHKLITGYRDLSGLEIEQMNAVKSLGARVGDLIELLDAPEAGAIDKRWLAIAKTELQKGFMFLTRAIARPESF